jgi:hypothetical protein
MKAERWKMKDEYRIMNEEWRMGGRAKGVRGKKR